MVRGGDGMTVLRGSRRPSPKVRGPHRGRNATRGFTLLEVVVALSLLALAVALALGTLRGATQATQRAEATAQRDERLRAVQGFLRRQVGGALPMAMAIDPQSGEARFWDGGYDKLEFVAAMPGYLSRGGPQVQTLELVGDKLQFQFAMLTPDGPLDPERDPVVLLDGIDEASFEYRTFDDRGRPGAWRREWEQKSVLPPLVRLKVRFKDPRRHWPELVLAPRLATPTAPAPIEAIASPGITQ
jgi:general secretion pathway protein J